jgi:hypothetical protein
VLPYGFREDRNLEFMACGDGSKLRESPTSTGNDFDENEIKVEAHFRKHNADCLPLACLEME